MSKVRVTQKTRVRPGRERTPKLRMWQARLSASDREYGPEVAKMDEREKIYGGERKLQPLVKSDRKDLRAPHVRNIVFENIESQVSSDIPQPKVTPVREKDEQKAVIIENWLRGELNRQKFEAMNDMAERTVPIQGGTIWLVEWNNRRRTHNTVGALENSMVHPKQLAPQPGVYTGIEDMDWVIIKMPTTKGAIRRKYGVDVWGETESEPELRGVENVDLSEDALTMYIGFELNDSGGINRFSWVNDTIVEDIENYQARREPVCAVCGRVRPLPGQIIASTQAPEPEDREAEQIDAGHAMARKLAGMVMGAEQTEGRFLEGVELLEGKKPEPRKYDGGPCPWCGGEKWETREMEYEQVILPIDTVAGSHIPGEYMGTDELGNPGMVPTLIPYYRPDVYPVVLQRSVSIFGKLLGNSDVDVIRDQQNTINRLEKKIIDRLIKAGTRITLPNKANLKLDPEDGERWYLDKPSEKALIDVYEFSGNLQYELAFLAILYEEPRQILGITDAFQGRRDTTATSGAAKQFSAAQSAGRLESKRVMKQAAYAEMFELMFKFQLAYADEPRSVTYKDAQGKNVYAEFNRYDFLEQDGDGQWYWNDQFLFSCDNASPLASNREAMWQETRQNLQSGAFGNPTATDTLILFWGKMELLHYPGAGETKKYLEQRLEKERTQMQMMAPAGADSQTSGTVPARMQSAAGNGGGYTMI